jgi:hypothetical protein
LKFLRSLFASKWPSTKTQDAHLARAPRFHFSIFENLVFKIKTTSESHQLEIFNISSTGIALLYNESIPIPNQFDGFLELNGTTFNIELQVIHKTKEVVGCKFISHSEKFISSLQKFFKMQFIASAFAEVNSDFLRKPENGSVHWFIDGSNNEIYYTLQNESVSLFYITLNDRYIEGTAKNIIKTGQLSSDKAKDLAMKSSRTVNYDDTPDKETLKKSLQLLQYVEHFCKTDFNAVKVMITAAIG